MNMLDSLYDKMHQFDHVTGVTLLIETDGTYSYTGIGLQKKGRKIQIVQRYPQTSDLNSWGLKKGTPCFFVVKGKGIITKWISSDTHADNLVGQLFPNAKEEDYVYQKEDCGSRTAVAITRKDHYEQIILQLKESNLLPVMVIFEMPVLAKFFGITHSENGMYQYESYQLVIKDKEINTLTISENDNGEAFVFGNDRIPETELPAYSIAFLVLTKLASFELYPLEIEESFSELKAKNIFQKTIRAAAIAVGLILIVNTYFFFSLRDQVNEASIEAGAVEEIVTLKQNLANKVENKKSFLKKTGWLQQSRLSFYSDRIASTVPESIILSKMRINPYNKHLSDKQSKPVFEYSVIEIDAICLHPTDINPWVKQMQQFEWIKNEIAVEEYKYDSEKKRGVFSLKINLSI